MQNDIPQLYFDVDRDMAKLMGVSVSDIFTTVKAFTGSVYCKRFQPLQQGLQGLYSGRRLHTGPREAI